MSDWISQPKEKALGWWLIGAWFFLFTFAALGNSIVTAFYGMRWNEMDWQDRIMVGILIFVNWATVMMAFLNKAVSRVQKGELPIAEGDTQLFKHGTVTETEHKTRVTKLDPVPSAPTGETTILKKIEDNTASTAASTAAIAKDT